MRSKLLQTAAIFMVIIAAFVSCSKSSSNNNNSSSTAQVSMRLTDDPGNYDAVYVDIQQIGVTMTGKSEVMITPSRPGVYNLLSFKNNLDTLLANTTLPAGSIEQIRLVLGSNNSVVVGGVSYPLTTPSAQESGVKLNLQTTLAAGASYVIWIDFDAGKSIVLTGSSTYKLKPVIRAYSALTNGQISGYALPSIALPTVYAINGTDTASAIPNADGHFVISGLGAGSWQLLVVPGLSTYLSYSATVNVTYGTITDVGTITLHQ